MVRLFAFAKLTFVCLEMEKEITLLTNVPKHFSLLDERLAGAIN